MQHGSRAEASVSCRIVFLEFSSNAVWVPQMLAVAVLRRDVTTVICNNPKSPMHTNLNGSQYHLEVYLRSMIVWDHNVGNYEGSYVTRTSSIKALTGAKVPPTAWYRRLR